MNKILVFVLLFSTYINSQTWKYSEETDPFDGKTLFVTARGYGGEFPYENPSIIIRYKKAKNDIDVYITGLGYTGCDNNKLRISYDNNPNNVKGYSVSESVGNDALFINDSQFKELFDDLKKHSIISVKFENRCTINTFSFGLRGSSAAINRLLNQTKQFNPEIERLEAERERKQMLIDNKKNIAVNETFYRLLDSMKTLDISENTVKEFESSLIRKIRTQFDMNPDLSEYRTIEILPHKVKGRYTAFIKDKNDDYETINALITFNKKSDEEVFEKRYNKFKEDLEYLKVADYSLEEIEKRIKTESKNIFEDITFNAIGAGAATKLTGDTDFERFGRTSLYFYNSNDENIERQYILGNFYIEAESPLYEELNKELQFIHKLMNSYVYKFNRSALLQIKSSIYKENLNVLDVEEIKISKKKFDNKYMYNQGFRKLILVTKDGNEILISNLVNTKNKELQ